MKQKSRSKNSKISTETSAVDKSGVVFFSNDAFLFRDRTEAPRVCEPLLPFYLTSRATGLDKRPV